MAPSKRLNLSNSRADEDVSSSASSSSDSEQPRRVQEAEEEDDASQTEDESDEEFEIPPGFESVKGSGAVTRESVLLGDKELWFFKLPKHLDASALVGATFKVGGKSDKEPAGAAVARVAVGDDRKPYLLQREHEMLAGQLVNALPLAADRKRFVLAKPFARCFSLVEDHETPSAARPAEEAAVEKHKSKKKKHHHHEAVEAAAAAMEDEHKAAKKSKKNKKSKHHGDEPRAKKHKA